MRYPRLMWYRDIHRTFSRLYASFGDATVLSIQPILHRRCTEVQHPERTIAKHVDLHASSCDGGSTSMCALLVPCRWSVIVSA